MRGPIPDTPRVLFMIDRLGRGGAAQVVVNTALALDRSEFQPIVCVTRRAPALGQDDMLKEAGIPLIQLNRYWRWQILNWASLWRVLPTVEILHAHESGSNFWGRLWGRCFGVPVIITEDHTAADAKRGMARWMDRVMSPLSDRIVTVSQFNRALSIEVENLPPDKVMAIYGGVDIERFAHGPDKDTARQLLGLPPDKRILAMVARLTKVKNHRGFFQSLLLLSADMRSRICCLMVGDGELREELEQQVRDLGLSDIVRFLGERRDVPVILRAIDLLVLPSHTECLPVVLMEGLAAGCPMVATAVGGVPEVLEEAGWPLVRPGDMSELAAAISKVLSMSESERNMKIETGRKVAQQKFSTLETAHQVQALYRALLASRLYRRRGGKRDECGGQERGDREGL